MQANPRKSWTIWELLLIDRYGFCLVRFMCVTCAQNILPSTPNSPNRWMFDYCATRHHARTHTHTFRVRVFFSCYVFKYVGWHEIICYTIELKWFCSHHLPSGVRTVIQIYKFTRSDKLHRCYKLYAERTPYGGCVKVIYKTKPKIQNVLYSIYSQLKLYWPVSSR